MLFIPLFVNWSKLVLFSCYSATSPPLRKRFITLLWFELQPPHPSSSSWFLGLCSSKWSFPPSRKLPFLLLWCCFCCSMRSMITVLIFSTVIGDSTIQGRWGKYCAYWNHRSRMPSPFRWWSLWSNQKGQWWGSLFWRGSPSALLFAQCRIGNWFSSSLLTLHFDHV